MTLGAITQPIQQHLTGVTKTRSKPCSKGQQRQIELQEKQLELQKKSVRLQNKIQERQKWTAAAIVVLFAGMILSSIFPRQALRALNFIVRNIPGIGYLVRRYRQSVALKENTIDLTAKARSKPAYVKSLRKLPSEFMRSVKDSLDRRQNVIVVVPDKSAKANFKMQLALEHQARELNQTAIEMRNDSHYSGYVTEQLHTTFDAMTRTNDIMVIDDVTTVTRSVRAGSKQHTVSATNPRGGLRTVILLTPSELAELHAYDPAFVDKFIIHNADNYPSSGPKDGPKKGGGTGGNSPVGTPRDKSKAAPKTVPKTRTSAALARAVAKGWRIDPAASYVAALQTGKFARGPQAMNYRAMSPGVLGRMVRGQLARNTSGQLFVGGQVNLYMLASVRRGLAYVARTRHSQFLHSITGKASRGRGNSRRSNVRRLMTMMPSRGRR